MHKSGSRPIWARGSMLAAGGLGIAACTAILWLYLAPVPGGESVRAEPGPAVPDLALTREIVKKKPASPAPGSDPAPVSKLEPETKPAPAPAPASEPTPAPAPAPEPAPAPAPASEPATASRAEPSAIPATPLAEQKLESPTLQQLPNAAWPTGWKESWLSIPASLRPDVCHWLERVGEGASSRLVGFVSDETERGDLQDRLLASGGAAKVDVEIEPGSSSICRLAETLAGRSLPAPQRMLRLEPDVDRLRDGDKFKIIIDAPDIDSMVSVHYLDAGGAVHTLFPSAYQTLALVGPGEELAVLAFDDLDLWEVSPPLGREAILLLAQTDELLLPLYEGSEPLDTFLARLQAALGSPADFSKPLASMLVLETSER